MGGWARGRSGAFLPRGRAAARWIAAAFSVPLIILVIPGALAAAPMPADGLAHRQPAGAALGPADTVRAPGAPDLFPGLEPVEIRRREVGFDVGLIDFEAEGERAAATFFTELLNARAPNLSIQQASGLSGLGSRVRIRGVNSFLLGNNPLVFVDGVRVSNRTDLQGIATGGPSTSRFEDLNPEEIARVQVLRGPAAAALYGAGASAGVLLVETRRGGAVDSRRRATLQVSQGLVADRHDYPDNYFDVSSFFDVTDPADPRLGQFRTAQNPITGSVFVLDNPLTDADSRPFRNGHQQTYAGTVRGLEGAFGYFGSLEYQDLQGSLSPSERMAVNARANLDLRAGDRLGLSLSGSFLRSELAFPDENLTFMGHAPGSMFGLPLDSFGTDPVDGPGQGLCLYEALTGEEVDACELRNGLARARFDILERIEQGEEQNRFVGSARATATPSDWLTLRAVVGRDESRRTAYKFFPFLPGVPVTPFDQGSITHSEQEDRTTTLDAGAAATFDLSADLRSTTSVGLQRFDSHFDVDTCTGSFLSTDTRPPDCGPATAVTWSQSVSRSREIGILLQQRLGFRDYLFGSVGVRRTGLRALPNPGWAPSLSLSAVLSELPSFRSEAVDMLRLRLAWGVGHKAPPPPLQELRPERTQELELGADAELLDRRLTVGVTYFRARTSDVLLPQQMPPSIGFVASPFENGGSLTDRGLELGLDARLVDRPGLAWDARFSAATRNPRVTEHGADGPFFFGPGGSSQRFQAGLPPGAFVGPVVSGARRAPTGEITSFDLLPGDLGDGSDFRNLGNPNVRSEQSLSTVLAVGSGFRIATLLDRRAGHQILNLTRLWRIPPAHLGISEEWAYKEARSTPEDQAMMEQAMIAPFVEDGSFVKWRELTVTYELPAGVASRAGARRTALTVGGRNLATLTGYSGVDPELDARSSRDELTGHDLAGVGIPQTWFATLRVAF